MHASESEIVRATLDVQGVHCVGCVWLMDALLRGRRAAGEILVNPSLGRVELLVDWAFRPSRVRHQRRTLRLPIRAADQERGLPSQDLLWRLGICAAVAMNSMIFGIAIYAGLDQGPLFSLFTTLNVALSAVAVAVGDPDSSAPALQALRQRLIHLDLPIALGIALAFAGSIHSYVTRRSAGAYFDTLNVFIALMLVGRWLQERVVERNRAWLLASDGTDSLLARRIVDGRVRLTRCAEIAQTTRCCSHRVTCWPWTPGWRPRAPGSHSTGSTARACPAPTLRGKPFRPGPLPPGREACTLIATDRVRVVAAPRLASSARTARGRRRADVGLVAAARTVLRARRAGHRDRRLRSLVRRHARHRACPERHDVDPHRDMPLRVRNRDSARVRNRSGRLAPARPVCPAGGVSRSAHDPSDALSSTRPGPSRPAPWSLPTPRPRWRSIRCRARPWSISGRSKRTSEESRIREVLDAHGATLDAGARVVESPGLGVELVRRAGAFGWGGSRGWPRACADVAFDVAFGVDGDLLARFATTERLRPDAAGEVDALVRDGYEVWLLSGDTQARVDAAGRASHMAERRCIGDQNPADKARFLGRVRSDDTLFVGDGVNDALAIDRAYVSGTPSVDRPFVPARADFSSSRRTRADPTGSTHFSRSGASRARRSRDRPRLQRSDRRSCARGAYVAAGMRGAHARELTDDDCSHAGCALAKEFAVEVVTLQVFVSLMLVVGSVLLFAFTCRQRDFDHADRLALLPLEDEKK